jgi:hypothetical protein
MSLLVMFHHGVQDTRRLSDTDQHRHECHSPGIQTLLNGTSERTFRSSVSRPCSNFGAYSLAVLCADGGPPQGLGLLRSLTKFPTSSLHKPLPTHPISPDLLSCPAQTLLCAVYPCRVVALQLVERCHRRSLYLDISYWLGSPPTIPRTPQLGQHLHDQVLRGTLGSALVRQVQQKY